MNDNENKLRQELLADAQRQAEQAMGRARAAATNALAVVREEQAQVREKRLQEAQLEAEARARAITARIRHEVQRRWLMLREEGLERLFAEVLPRLERGDGIDRQRSLRQLLQEALEALGPMAVKVRLNPDSAALLTAEALAAVCSLAWPNATPPPRVERAIDAGLRPGVVVESADGRLVFDNTYATRLERLRGPLRSLASAAWTPAESDDDSHA
jgi:vacuolar-type H+-ATPase subunit E/Vma4